MTPEQVCAYWAIEGLDTSLLPILHKLVAEGFVYHNYERGNDYALSATAYVEVGARGIQPRRAVNLRVFHDREYAIDWADADAYSLRELLLDLQRNQT